MGWHVVLCMFRSLHSSVKGDALPNLQCAHNCGLESREKLRTMCDDCRIIQRVIGHVGYVDDIGGLFWISMLCGQAVFDIGDGLCKPEDSHE